MNARADHLLQRLSTGKLIGIDHGEGSRVSCVEGALWITQSNDPRDIVIEAESRPCSTGPVSRWFARPPARPSSLWMYLGPSRRRR